MTHTSIRPVAIVVGFICLSLYALIVPVVLFVLHWERFRNACLAFAAAATQYFISPLHFVFALFTTFLLTGFLLAILWTITQLVYRQTNGYIDGHDFCASTVGFFSPKVIISPALKATLSTDAYRAILAHEVYHQLHYHPLIIFLAGFLRRWFFFIPFAAHFFERVVLYLELKADRHAITVTSRKALAQAMHEFFSYKQAPRMTPMAANFSILSERVEAIMHPQPHRNVMLFFWPMAIFAFLGLLFPLYIVYASDITQATYQAETHFVCPGHHLPAQSPMTPVQSKFHQY